MIWQLWKKGKLNSEKIWKIRKKRNLKFEKIWNMRRKVYRVLLHYSVSIAAASVFAPAAVVAAATVVVVFVSKAC
jgi:hypothetical protein